MTEPYIPCTPQRWDATIPHNYSNLVFKNLDQTDILYFLRLLQKAEWQRCSRISGDDAVVAEIKPSMPPIEIDNGES